MSQPLPSPVQELEALIAAESFRSISMLLGMVTLLLYDHLITFDDEVAYIWKKKITPLSVLYLMNRYFSPLAFVLSMVAGFSRDWSIDRCRPFALLQEAVTVCTALVAEAMLILRVYAVYQQRKSVLILLGTMWITQLALMGFLMKHTGPLVVPNSPVGRYGCGPGVDPGDAIFKSFFLFFTVPPLVFDSTTFFLLLFALYRRVKNRSQFSMFKLILRDGCLYWLVVCCINLTWTIFTRTLVDELKNILAFPSATFTVILIGRLTLNIRMHVPPIVYEGASRITIDLYDLSHREEAIKETGNSFSRPVARHPY